MTLFWVHILGLRPTYPGFDIALISQGWENESIQAKSGQNIIIIALIYIIQSASTKVSYECVQVRDRLFFTVSVIIKLLMTLIYIFAIGSPLQL